MERKKITLKDILTLGKYGLAEIESDNLSLLHFHKGDYICVEGQPLEYLLIVAEGKAKVCLSGENGKTLLLAFYSGAGILGDVELMSGSAAAKTTVQAITDFICIGIPLDHYGAWLQGNNAFINCAGAALAQKLDRCGRNSALNILYPLEARLCTYIKMMQENGYFHDNLTTLAELMGTSYRHLLRTFDRLCSENILCKEGHSYKIVDPGKLLDKGKDYYLT